METIGVVTKLTNNKIINAIDKIVDVKNKVDTYNEKLQSNNTNTDALVKTTTTVALNKPLDTANLLVSSELALTVASGGAFTPVSCGMGALCGAISYCVNNHYISKSVDNFVEGLPSMKSVLNQYVFNAIEDTLQNVYHLSSKSISVITNTITNIFVKEYKEIVLDDSVIYCKDQNNMTLLLPFTKKTMKQIYDCCEYMDNHQTPTLLKRPLSNYRAISKFENKYHQFENHITTFQNDFETQYRNAIALYEETLANTPSLIPPNTSQLERSIYHTVPTYQPETSYTASGHFSGSGGGNNFGEIIGTFVFVIQFTFFF